MGSERDAYVRALSGARQVHQRTPGPKGLVFVDVPGGLGGGTGANDERGLFRSVPIDVLASADSVLLRVAGQDRTQLRESAKMAAEQLEYMGAAPSVGIIGFAAGYDPVIQWADQSRAVDDDALMARARRIELDALITWGRARWKPSGYHYELPSGEHAATFIRLADAFQDPRAAEAIASWLLPALHPDVPTSIVLDVGTLMPIITELEKLASSEGRRAVGDVRVLDRYPSNALGVQRSLLSWDPASPALGIVSVSDSGSFAERLMAALTSFGSSKVTIEAIVGRRGAEGTSVTRNKDSGNVPEDPWLVVDDPPGSPASGCQLCRDPERARLVRVNPRSMSAMVLPEPDLVVPDVFEAQRNKSLWERYQRVGSEAISLLGGNETRPTSYDDRTAKDSVFFEPAKLLADDPYALFGNRLEEFKRFPARSSEDVRDVVRERHGLVANESNFVIFEQAERDQFTDAQWADLQSAVVTHSFADETADWIDHKTLEERTISDQAAKVLVVALGLRTGLTLQREFLTARAKWPNGIFHGLVLHAHPDDDRSWRSVQNTFTDSMGKRRLLSLWLTLLPSRSPILDEKLLLEAAQPHIQSDDIEARLTAIDDGLKPGEVLWGRSDPRLEPNSYLGEGLTDVGTLLAVGAAMHKARLEARLTAEPQYTRFDLRRAFRSYFDGLIHAAILRWCEPHEAWWGHSPESSAAFIEQLRGLDFDFNLLLPELLLAAAQEKVPLDVGLQLRTFAEHRSASGAASDREQRFLGIGISLLDHIEELHRSVDSPRPSTRHVDNE